MARLTDSARKLIRSANDIFRREFGSLDGVHPTYAWQYSASGSTDDVDSQIPCELCGDKHLVTTIPVVNSLGEPQLDFVCGCGVNVRVHSPECNGWRPGRTRSGKLKQATLKLQIQMKTVPLVGAALSRAKIRTMQVRICPDLNDVFVICKFIPPPSREAWIASMGSDQGYPSHGSYTPVSNNGVTAKVQDAVLIPGTTSLFTRMLREHFSRTMADWEAESDLSDRKKEGKVIRHPVYGSILSSPPRGANFYEKEAQVRDRLTLGGHEPGKKQHVSYGPASSKSSKPSKPYGLDKIGGLDPSDSKKIEKEILRP
jgi:hypothetical protein